MMKKLNILTLAIGLSLIAWACSTASSSATGDETRVDTSAIALTQAPASPDYPDATLTKSDLIITQKDSLFSLNYSFDVQGYELGIQTADADTRGIANSGKGQHIHYIVNNGPYAAHYMNKVPDELAAGNYVVLAFLSRSYHESVKSENAYFVENISVGEADPSEADLTAPHLFYSRPKGTYTGADTEKVMLDFYLLNTTLSKEGNKVKATINDAEFIIDTWAPFYITGLPMGESTIQLELINADGMQIPGPFNKVERKISLSE